jgi:hypothetical protein
MSRYVKIALAITLLLGFISIAATPPYNPIVKAKLSYSGQGADVPTTTIWTPGEDGDYHLDYYIVDTVTHGNPSLNWTFGWADDVEAQSNSGNLGCGGCGPATGSLVIHAASGQPITFNATYADDGSGGTFDIYITLVKE